MNSSECDGSPVSGDQLGIAFALVIGAGLATAFGAAIPLLLELPCRCCIHWRQPKALNRFLASGLAFAAGVMMYVSFVEIYVGKGIPAFTSCVGSAYGGLYGGLSFFGGMLLSWLLMLLVHAIQHCIGTAAQRQRGNERVVSPRFLWFVVVFSSWPEP